jgi:hypothetical protein
MRLLTVAIWLCISSVAAAQAAPTTATCTTCGIKKAPAPLIGSGIPVALVVGGALLGFKLSTRWRRA